jgi:VCBS repeat-containing protein
MAFNISPSFTGPVSFTSVLEDVSNPGGILVSTLFTSSFTDANGNLFAGIAISADTSVSATDGNWQYSLNGTTWVDINKPPSNKVPLIDQALLLSSSTYLRFVPALNFSGTPGNLTVFAVDNSSLTTFSTAANQRYFDTTGDDHEAIDANQSRVSASGVLLTTSVTSVNDVPSFTNGADQTFLEDSGVHTVTGWASSLSAGPANESSQLLNFIVTNSNNSLFSVQPAVDSNGNLTYTQAGNANGSATVTVQIHDNGGTANGGVDTSASKTFIINMTSVNDAPVASGSATLAAINEDTLVPVGATVSTLFTPNFSDAADAIAGGSSANTLAGVVVVSNAANAVSEGVWQYYNGTIWQNVGTVSTSSGLFVASAGLLRFVAVGNYNGSPTGLTVRLADNSTGTLPITGNIVNVSIDGTNSGGTTRYSNSSNTVTLNTTVTAVNDVPTLDGVTTGAVTEDVSVTGNNLTTSGLLTISDPDTGESTFSVQAGTAGSYGTFSLLSNGSWSYVADNRQHAIQALAAGSHLTESFTAVSVDGSASQNVTITINGNNDDPTVSEVLSNTASEGASVYNLNLLLHASDIDAGDKLTVGSVTYTVNGFATGHIGSDLPSGVTLIGNTLTVDPTDPAFNHLAVGGHTIIQASYIISDGNSGSVDQTETITINGTNDLPMVSAAVSSTASEGDASYDLYLMLHASDPDTSDTLSVASVTYTVDGVPTGNGGDDLPPGVTRTDSTLTVDPTDPAFNHLGVSEHTTIVASYTIADGNGGLAHQTATVTINGMNDPPTVSGAESSSVSIGTPAYDLNLLLLASDPEGDPLTVSNVTYTVDGIPTGNGGNDLPSGVTLTGSMLTVDPANPAYASYDYGDYVAIIATYTIADGHGGSVLQTETVTLTRTEDFPVIAQPESFTASEGDISSELNLLLHASDPEDDDLSVDKVIYTVDGVATGSSGSVSPSGITRSDSTLTLDPTDPAFNHLAVGEHTTILVDYSVVDHAGGSVAQIETITINGTNDLPTVSAAENSLASEGEASYNVSLLLHASDPDTSDMLTVGNVTYTVDGTPTGNGGDDLPTGFMRTGSTLTVDPTNAAFNALGVGEHTTIVASYTIADGNGGLVSQTAAVTINGNNQADITPPTLIAFSPEDGVTGVSINDDIILTFSEAVLRGLGTIAIHSGTPEGSVLESYDAATSTNLTISGSTLTINPTSSLVHGTHYYVTLADGSIIDYEGNHFAGITSYDFTTGADPFASIHNDDNESTELIIAGVGALGILAWLVF